ncbi:Rpn family recombination-promoting nuclease/putative transposase [Desulfamplus magnetovallimortis]|uniref:Rpn family recombination-promoting nuclease/putative transposase n=1 Tax=Desulfamplus magnetovallimortis TaxID=1246637 RepID=UPI00111A3F7B|nr:Rpn family recombination-promoting nuclease/putative transposase [Desulfamplus magnetovallimortis]
MKKVKTPHDNLFRETFSRRENALSFIKTYLSPVLLEAVLWLFSNICLIPLREFWLKI